MERPYAENFLKKFFRKIGSMSLIKAYKEKVISDAEINQYYEAEETLGIGR